jgi:hypothetical protein
MYRLVAIIAIALAVVLVPGSISQAEEDPQQSIYKREPKKLGPQTEQVDLQEYSRVLHVAPSGSDKGDGSKSKPLASPAQALAAVKDATTENRHAILVAAGEYKGDTIEMKPHVDLFGGFDEKSWNRDIDANRSVLDGEQARRVVTGADNARIDGFVIRNGKVRGPGGGMLCEHTSPTISNNIFTNNTALEPADIRKELYHQHGHDGGAIACVTGSNAVVRNNVIAGNTTEVGGGAGIAVSNWSMPHILNNVICHNETGLTDDKQSRSSNGGGISASNALLRPPLRMLVINNVIANNRANGNSDAGGIYCEYDSAPLIGANWILSNWSEDDGAGVYIMKASQPLLTSNIIAGQQGYTAVRLSKEGRADIEHNLMFGNVAAITCVSSWMNLKNNTIVDNAAGVSHENSYAPHLKPPVVTENLIYGNRGGQFSAVNTGDDAPTVSQNNIQGGYGGEGNFDEKPSFADDGAKAPIRSLDYDEDRIVTEVAVADVPAGDELVGRVAHVGNKWSVIKECSDGKIVVWGDLRPAGQQSSGLEFHIAPSYELRTPLGVDVGAQAAR